MAINKRVIHFKTKKKFQEALDNGDILSTSIVFIKDTLELYTHEQLYSFANREAFDELVNKVSNLSDKVIEDILGEQANNANEVGAAVLVNKSTLRKVIVRPDKITDYSPEIYEPIGIVAIPASHDVYGTRECGVVSLMAASLWTPDTGSNGVQTMYFGSGERVDEVTNYQYLSTMRISNKNIELLQSYSNGYLPTDCSGMFGPSSLDGFSRYKFQDTTFAPSPYNFNGSKNPIYHIPGNLSGDNNQYINSLNPIYGQPIKTSDNLIISWERQTNLWNKFPNSDAYDGKQWVLTKPNTFGKYVVRYKINGGPGKIIFKCRVNGVLSNSGSNPLIFEKLDNNYQSNVAAYQYINPYNRNQWFYINYDILDSSEHFIDIHYDYQNSYYPNIDNVEIYVAREGFVQYIPGGTSASSNALSDFNGKYNTQVLCSKATAQADWKTSMGTPATEEIRETVITAEGFNIRWETQTGEWIESENSDSYDGKKFTSVSPGDGGETRLRCIVSGKAGKLAIKYMSDAESSYDYLMVSDLDTTCDRGINEDEEYRPSQYKYSTKDKQNQWLSGVYDIPDENEHFIEFCYSKDGSQSSGQDHAQVYIALQAEGVLISPAKPATPAIENKTGNGYYPAACCCWRYHTLGTNQGDWYLPTLGELGYCWVTLEKIQNTIQYLQNHFNKNYPYISNFVGSDDYDGDTDSLVSSSLNNNSRYYISFLNGSTGSTSYNTSYFVRPFLRLKLEQENKINMSTINQALTKHINSKRHIPEGGDDKQILIWKADGEARWEHLFNIFSNLEDTFAYGVEWDVNVDDPHLTRIGNMSFHKTLPIQSQLKGCIAQGNKIMYWLDENDWRFRKDGTIIAVDLTSNTNTFNVPSVEGLGINQYLRSGENLARITAIDAEASTITVEWKVAEGVDSTNLATLNFLEIGSRLDGYDGTVRVYCPSFYIKSEIIGNIRRVWLSTMKIDDTWTHQPEILVDAYRCTVLNTVPENMGYLSTLPVDSAISVVNTSDYCRGGGNRSDFDKYLNGAAEGAEVVSKDIFRTDLGKPRTSLSTLSTYRTKCRNAHSNMLSYDQYKNIFYWLYVVEYANFDCQEEFNENLTEDGYHQGGMGIGITNAHAWQDYNNSYPITPCGYGNHLGNRTGLVPLTVPEFGRKVGVILNMNNYWYDSSNITKVDGKMIVTNITGTGFILRADWNKVSVKTTYKVTGLTEYGETIIFYTSTSGQSIRHGELSEDGTITIEWPNTQVNRYISFSEVKNNVNIVIEVESAEAGFVLEPSYTQKMPRWRGFDNNFGDLWTLLDGLLVDVDADSHPNNTFYVYTCQDPTKYDDNLNDSYNKVGEEVNAGGYTHQFDLGNEAHIIPSSTSSHSNRGMCDYHWSAKGKVLRPWFVGGSGEYSITNGIACVNVALTTNNIVAPQTGFRSVSQSVSFN